MPDIARFSLIIHTAFMSRTTLRPNTARSLGLILCLSMFTNLLWSQQRYEAGYLVNPGGKRSEVAIKYKDWRFKPAEIQVREGNGVERTIATEALKAFGVAGLFHFEHFDVLIEKSNTQLNSLPDAPEPPVRSRELLRAEVVGELTLYSYREPGITKYFLQRGDETPVQLGYYAFSTRAGEMRVSKAYLLQLNEYLDCLDSPANENTKYSLHDLADLVTRHNNCAKGTSLTLGTEVRPSRNPFHFGVLPGVYFANFSVHDPSAEENGVKTSGQTTFRMALEMEYILPFGVNKWSVMLSPSVYQFQSAGTYEYYPIARPVRTGRSEINYRALDIPLGLRYYSFAGEDLKAFGELHLGYRIIDGDPVDLGRYRMFDFSPTFTGLAGVGLRYRDHLQLAVRYQWDTNGLDSAITVSNSGGLWVSAAYIL